jgi:hypothetical protein
LCYQSQISKFLRENRRNPNLKQDSESSFKSRVRICLFLVNLYIVRFAIVSSSRGLVLESDATVSTTQRQ